MKNIYKIIISFIISSLLINLSYSYDQVFPTVKLRHWYSYYFWDNFKNTWTWDVWVESYSARLIEKWGYNYNWKSDDNMFSWDQDLKDKWFIVKWWEEVRAYSATKYDILYVPPEIKNNNLEIIYTSNYYRNTSDWWVWPVSHTEYQPYEITWCWDWILDRYTDIWWDRIYEQCDPNDPNKTWWWSQTCNNQCELEGGSTWSAPVCNSLTVSNPIWVDTLTTNVSCTWTNVTAYSIDCWNGTKASLTDGSGTCTYSAPWNYTSACYVGSTTVTPPAACQQTVQVIDSSDSCEWWTTWVQTSPLTSTSPNLCTAGFSLVSWSFSTDSTTIPNTSLYSWSCTDWVNNFSGGTCRASYIDTSTSCIWWTDSWTRTSSLSSSSPNLCTAWFTYTDGTFTQLTSWSTTNYTWWCTNNTTNEETTWWTCNAIYTSWWSSWWDPYQCRDIRQDLNNTWNEVTCEWNLDVETFRLTCNWNEYFKSWSDITTDWNLKSAIFSCTDTTAYCSVYDAQVTTSWTYAWRTSTACQLENDWGGGWWGWSSKKTCWDGLVQRPNSNWVNEECDYGDWVWPLWCNQTTCKVSDFTQPWAWDITFWPSWLSYILGNGMNLYDTYTIERPYIKNDSYYDLYFDELCITPTSWSSLNWGTQCEDIDGILFPHDRFEFTNNPNYTWNTSSLSDWSSQINKLTVTIKHEETLYDNAYFAESFDVTVSKPSIATTWGWTSYVKNTVTNVSNLTWKGDVKNFVWVWVWSSTASSYNSDITDSRVDEIEEGWEKYVSSNTSSASRATVSEYDLNKFVSYNGIKNAYVLKSKDLVIDTDLFSGLSWPRTYIVEGWDIYIKSDINYADNIAFVAKWWNIIIDEDVTSIKGTFIALASWYDYWEINWNWKTLNQLVVNWSLYGDISGLVDNREYIKYEWDKLSVGTIVSFGSSVFRDPAPLVSTFISDYQKSQKIAK